MPEKKERGARENERKRELQFPKKEGCGNLGLPGRPRGERDRKLDIITMFPF